MSCEFIELAKFPISKLSSEDDDFVFKKLRTAFHLSWELPQIVIDRIFASSLVQIKQSDIERLESAGRCFSEDATGLEGHSKYLAYTRFRTNVCLKVLTAYSSKGRFVLALFATETSKHEWNEELVEKKLPVVEFEFGYGIQLSVDSSQFSIFVTQARDEANIGLASSFGLREGWLQYGLGKKLCIWMSDPDFETEPSQPRSLRLVDTEKYIATYLTLKESVGSYWIQNWPERTDPQKFVFEELAIATYLVTIFCQHKTANQIEITFADMGCGNGFLTYALNNLGFNPSGMTVRGIGIDARKRKIWDIYPNMDGKLVKAPISADNLAMFTETEWFIGNHSDELTPWIPYIASKSNCHSKVFVLPCCPFDFHAKYKYRVAGKSLYGGYLDYIERICRLSGFEVERDRLRIPSTKRICFVCTKRADLTPEDMEKNRSELEKLGAANLASIDPVLPKDPQVRNCTNLSEEAKHFLLSQLFKMILSSQDEFATVVLANGKTWRAGGRVALSAVAASLHVESIDALKNQDGGVKTFAKNYCNVFQVLQGSLYMKRHPIVVEFLTKLRKRTKLPQAFGKSKSVEKPCWFEMYHPDGCPYWQVNDEGDGTIVCRAAHKT